MDLNGLSNETESVRIEKENIEKELITIKEQYDKLRSVLEQKAYTRKRRENTATTYETISYSSSSRRYRRRKESQNILEYIHGGKEGAIYGAWYFVAANANPELMQSLFTSYKQGKFLEKLYGKFSNILENREQNIKKALATKYMNYLSRRKYNMT